MSSESRPDTVLLRLIHVLFVDSRAIELQMGLQTWLCVTVDIILNFIVVFSVKSTLVKISLKSFYLLCPVLVLILVLLEFVFLDIFSLFFLFLVSAKDKNLRCFSLVLNQFEPE